MFELVVPLSRFIVQTTDSRRLADVVEGLSSFSSLLIDYPHEFPKFLSTLTQSIPLTSE
jgi:hypothetical protein